ncbi:MAG: hypothetical protein Q8T03_03085, partial [Bacteroidota bacterium]|nr:hypothetical protein [Bacteroidota bacterium]
NLNAVKSNFGLMASDIIETQTTDSQGQATFLNVPVNTGKVSYRIQSPQSTDYSSSDYIQLEKNSEIILFLSPLLTKKLIINKPASISKYNVFVSCDFFNNDGVLNNTSTTNSYFFKFVPSRNNQILIDMTTTLNTNKDTIINISPTQNDTSTININL